jgi:hypothetical protein
MESLIKRCVCCIYSSILFFIFKWDIGICCQCRIPRTYDIPVIEMWNNLKRHKIMKACFIKIQTFFGNIKFFKWLRESLYHKVWKQSVSFNEVQILTGLSDLYSSGRWDETDSPATWSHPDLSEPVTGQDSGIKIGDYKGWKIWPVRFMKTKSAVTIAICHICVTVGVGCHVLFNILTCFLAVLVFEVFFPARK